MFEEYYHKNVKVTTKSGKIAIGYYSDYNNEYDNEGPATICVGKWEIEVNDIKKIELIEEEEKK